MQDIIDLFMEQSIVVKVIIVLVLFVIHSMVAVFLNKLNNVKYGKTSIIAWIPILNLCLLGKFVFNIIGGLILLIVLLFGACISFNIPKLESIHDLLPNEYVLPYQIGCGVIVIILFIIAKVKLQRIIRNGLGKDSMTNYINKDYDNKEPVVTPIEEQPVNENTMISDNFQYNHTSLSDLANHEENKNDNNENS